MNSPVGSAMCSWRDKKIGDAYSLRGGGVHVRKSSWFYELETDGFIMGLGHGRMIPLNNDFVGALFGG